MNSVPQPRSVEGFAPPRCPQCNCLSAHVVRHDMDGVISETHMCSLEHLWLTKWTVGA